MLRKLRLSVLALLSLSCAIVAHADKGEAFVRVNQIGYESGGGTHRAYLMSTVPEPDATFRVRNAAGRTVFTGAVGDALGTWGHSAKLTYQVYALDFQLPEGEHYTIAVSGPASARSPVFAVEPAEVLYPSLLVNSLFFYQTQRDGPDFIPNALRNAPGHLKDQNATRYLAPPIDDNDNIDNAPPTPPFVPADLPEIDAAGGWWDAGDYVKYVATESYTLGILETGVRDFPSAMGRFAPHVPEPAPNAVSYAGTSGPGAPRRPNFTPEARFGVDWLLRMWDAKHRALVLQVDNTQEWNFYGSGDPASTSCGGTYASPYCLITEYDIWTLPQAADNWQQAGDPQPCDQYTTFFICNRPVFLAEAPGAKISPNLAGRLAAAFALCYQIDRQEHPVRARRCLVAAEQVYALADTTSYPDPAPQGGPGSLQTAVPFDGYPETVWEDDMEWGATELATALEQARTSDELAPLSTELPVTNPATYLRQATQFASGYIANVAKPGFRDSLNLYDVSGLAHFELLRVLQDYPAVPGLALSAPELRAQLLSQVNAAEATAAQDPWGFGERWNDGDVTSHGEGLSVMASEAYALTGDPRYNADAQRWMANILGSNAWGSSFIVGDGSTFPNCIQHQVANIAGALNGTSGGTPILWGASVEGPSPDTSSGLVDGMRVCPASGSDPFARFNGNPGPFDRSQVTRYTDNVQSYTTTEPAIDLTAASVLMWSWRLHPLSVR